MKALVIKHVDVEGPGTLMDFLTREDWTVEVADLYAGYELPSEQGVFQWVITLGGPMNVYEEESYPFLKQEDAFLKLAISRGVPILGICLGSQLIAKASGGRVTRNPRKEIGWYPVQLTARGLNDGLYRNFPRTFMAFHWHGDVSEPPSNGVVLANSQFCNNQCFRLPEPACGIQFHLEVTRNMIEEWVERYREEIDDAGGKPLINAILRDADSRCLQLKAIADKFYGNFLRWINEQKIK